MSDPVHSKNFLSESEKWYQTVEIPARSLKAKKGAAGIAGNIVLVSSQGGVDAYWEEQLKNLSPNPIEVELEKLPAWRQKSLVEF